MSNFYQHLQSVRQIGMTFLQEELLQQASITLTQFAQTHCGPSSQISKQIKKGLFGIGSYQVMLEETYWTVGIEYTREVSPHGVIELYRCAILHLSPPSITNIWISLKNQNHYMVKIMTELKIPGVMKAGLTIASKDVIDAQADVLSDLLNGFIQQGVLVKDGHSLHFHRPT